MSVPSTPSSSLPSATDPPIAKLQKSKILIVCFDGTGQQYDTENSNVVKLFNMLKKDCEDEQMCYYQTGIGTYTNPGIFTPVFTYIAEKLDEAFAWYLDAHVMAGYRFLMQNYVDGDRICIFGFSRGAYTARALAGMLTKVGLLPKDNDEQVPFAWKMYTRTKKDAKTMADGFKKVFCRPVNIEFLGVWDTVASTGIIMSRTLPFTMSNTMIKTFRHAISLDEHRAKFVPTFYHRATSDLQAEKKDPERSLSVNPTSPLSAISEAEAPLSNGKGHPKGKKKARFAWIWPFSGGGNDENEVYDYNEGPDTTNVKEVWFSGCHGDIGGGSTQNNVKSCLSNIPLRWMIREIVASQCGILFDPLVMEQLKVHVPLTPVVSQTNGKQAVNGVNGINGQSQSVTEPILETPIDQSLDAVDAMQPLHDQLKAQPLWWIVEILPLTFTWQNAKGVWVSKREFHLGRGRYMPEYEPSPMFHETVRLRMQNKDLNYTPKAIYKPGTETYVC